MASDVTYIFKINKCIKYILLQPSLEFNQEEKIFILYTSFDNWSVEIPICGQLEKHCCIVSCLKCRASRVFVSWCNTCKCGYKCKCNACKCKYICL